MKTIAKNRTKFLDILFAAATECRAYSLFSGFSGVWCDARQIRSALERSRSSKLHDLGDGRYRVHVHSNEWYEFRSL